MRIGIDARFAIQKRRGIGNYTLNLVTSLAAIDSENQYILYTNGDDVEGVLPQKANFKATKMVPSNYFLWEQIILPRQVKRDRIDVLHCCGNTSPILLDRKVRLISTIHDVMYLKDRAKMPYSPSLYQRAGRIYRRVIVTRSASRLSMAITVSEFSKRDINRHIEGLGDERIRVTYEAANECFRPLNKSESVRKIQNQFKFIGDYILTLGAVDPRKNTALIIRSVIELKHQHPIKEKLIVVGMPHWEKTDYYKMIRGSQFESDIIFTDYISEDDLVTLYNGATVFLYPSLYEGFGIPPLEAMACGVPVITSSTTSLPEVVGNGAVQINPQDGEELKAALLKLLKDENLRKSFTKQGLEQADKFTWTRMAEETLAVYERVYGESRSG